MSLINSQPQKEFCLTVFENALLGQMLWSMWDCRSQCITTSRLWPWMWTLWTLSSLIHSKMGNELRAVNINCQLTGFWRFPRMVYSANIPISIFNGFPSYQSRTLPTGKSSSQDSTIKESLAELTPSCTYKGWYSCK